DMLVQQVPPNPRDDLSEADAVLEVREGEWPFAAHELGVARHDVEAGADVRREIDLVDHQEVRARNTGTTFARDLVASGDVDHIDRRVHELGAEAGRQIVAAGLEKDDLEVGVPSGQLVQRVEVHRRVFANGGV